MSESPEANFVLEYAPPAPGSDLWLTRMRLSRTVMIVTSIAWLLAVVLYLLSGPARPSTVLLSVSLVLLVGFAIAYVATLFSMAMAAIPVIGVWATVARLFVAFLLTYCFLIGPLLMTSMVAFEVERRQHRRPIERNRY